MALPQFQNTNKTEAKTLATDEAGMLKDAKEYARRDIKTVLNVFKAIPGLEHINDEIIAKSLIKVKYDFINASRNERPEYEKFFD